jgi:2-isopropylmalate synthase
VLIETHRGGRRWSTVGAGENIIRASWLALVDSVEYGLCVAPHEEDLIEAVGD